jgi:hypothetical protein
MEVIYFVTLEAYNQQKNLMHEESGCNTEQQYIKLHVRHSCRFIFSNAQEWHE